MRRAWVVLAAALTTGCPVPVQYREVRPGLKALFASGYSEQFLKGRGPGEAGVPLLNKPYRTRTLAEAVRNVLDNPQPP